VTKKVLNIASILVKAKLQIVSES